MADHCCDMAAVVLGCLQYLPLHAAASLANVYSHTHPYSYPHPPDSYTHARHTDSHPHVYPTDSHAHIHPTDSYTLAQLVPNRVSF
jgi:hypothetical protein